METTLNELRHITTEDFQNIIDLLNEMLSSNLFDLRLKDLHIIFDEVVELQPVLLQPMFFMKNKVNTKVRSMIISEMIEAAENKNCMRLRYLFPKLKNT